MPRPLIIQGGMGIAVSGWPLARPVSRQGQLGVVSGTALAVVLARRLQLGDPGGELRHALAQFPFPAMAAIPTPPPTSSASFCLKSARSMPEPVPQQRPCPFLS